MQKKICLIVPCYNEGRRLDFERFKTATNCYFLFVNDGSTDDTSSVIKDNCNDNIYLLDLPVNVGKGEAVRQGMLNVKHLTIYEEIEWLGFWDADLATSLTELHDFTLYASMFDQKIDAIWGSRVKKLGSDITRSALRHYLGRIFATFASIVLKLKAYDTQCGAKLFRKEIVEKYFKEPFISKWIFDIELLLRMKDANIIEYPLKKWEDISGSTLRIHSIALKTIYEVIKLRNKYL